MISDLLVLQDHEVSFASFAFRGQLVRQKVTNGIS